MEVAKNRRPGLLKIKTVRCKNCKSSLKVTYMDLHRVWDEENNTLIGYYLVCKACHKRVDLSMRKARRIL